MSLYLDKIDMLMAEGKPIQTKHIRKALVQVLR
jgi:hypothetical protein